MDRRHQSLGAGEGPLIDIVLPLRKVEARRLFQEAAEQYPPQVELAFLLQSMVDPRNVGSLFRIADSCGARELVFTGRTPVPPDEEIDRTSRRSRPPGALAADPPDRPSGQLSKGRGVPPRGAGDGSGDTLLPRLPLSPEGLSRSWKREQGGVPGHAAALRRSRLCPHAREGAVDECPRRRGARSLPRHDRRGAVPAR